MRRPLLASGLPPRTCTNACMIALAIPAASSATPMAPRISTAVAALAAGCTALSATTRPLRIGTRGSPLALAQAYMTRQLLMDNFEELSSEGAIQLVRSCFLF